MPDGKDIWCESAGRTGGLGQRGRVAWVSEEDRRPGSAGMTGDLGQRGGQVAWVSGEDR